MILPVVKVNIGSEHDVVGTRQRAHDIARLLGFDRQDQTRIATAVSEIARNALSYAGGGSAGFSIELEPASLTIEITDSGPGIPHLHKVLSGRYKSTTGMGLGIAGARRLMDEFHITAPAGKGTKVRMSRALPGGAASPTPPRIQQLCAELARQQPRDLLSELRHENRELLGALDELRQRQEDLKRLNRELEDTNRGVVALYAELEQKAESLRQADQMKSRFLSHMSHEFRTPLNSIVALSRLLLSETDGPLFPEQQRQVAYIRRSAENLYEMVNDLLDLAKVEAGKVEVQPAEFQVSSLFGGLRGVMKPMQTNPAVELIFEDPANIPAMITDEAKVAQVMRNLISNALKFTERGEVRVTASYSAAGDTVTFRVIDSGIGIAPEDQERIFQEFSQIANPIQKAVKGTGLGLALSRRFCELMGGSLRVVESAPGQGSTFEAAIPREFATKGHGVAQSLLLVDDEEVARYLMRQWLGPSQATVWEAENGPTALRLARERKPDAIFLDLKMPEMDGFEVLTRLKSDAETRTIPVIVVTSKLLTPGERQFLEESATGILSKEMHSEDPAARVRAALDRVGLRLAADWEGPHEQLARRT